MSEALATVSVVAPKAPVTGCVWLEPQADGIAILRLGTADETLVTLTEARIASLEAAIDELLQARAVRALIVTGPGPGMFAAGADIGAIRAIPDAAGGQAAAERGQLAFERLATLPVPVVAAIEGPCLGGGLELALACDLRIASDAASTRLGLPEVRLGIVPGFGGTQRLPRLIGLPGALDLILTGRTLSPKAALRTGVVDAIAPAARLLEVARREALRLIAADGNVHRKRWPLLVRLLSHTSIGRALVRRRAEHTLDDGNNRFYPAPRRALSLCVEAFTRPSEQGYAHEARALGELLASPESRALVRMFLLSEAQKRLGKGGSAAVIREAQVLGAGAMGAGIAATFAHAGIRVRLADLDGKALAAARARLQRALDKRTRRRKLEAHEAQAIMDRLAVGIAGQARLDRCQLFLEAVAEDLTVKRKVFADALARGLPRDAVLATNTSSLPIDAMAEGLPDPGKVVGIHFFNPPEKMPLVEIVRGARTTPATIATACRLVTQLGKFPLVVEDRPGFLVNRCLAPYLNQAAALLLEGHAPEAIDRAAREFGMPMGPCRLLDEIGFDIALKVSATLEAAFPDRLRANPLLAAMATAGALGQKSGGGIYGQDGRGPGPGRAIVATLRGRGVTPIADETELRARLLYPMVDEAFRCLAEGVVGSEDELDFGLVFGIGFPPFRGGLTGFAASEGVKHIVDTLDAYARALDPRLSPSDALRQRALGS